MDNPTTLDTIGMLVELSKGAGLLLAISYGFLWRNRTIGGDNTRENILFGVYIGLATIFGMMTAVNFSQGVLFDARSLLIGVASAFGGGLVAAISGLLAASYRIYLGGPGAITGISVIASSALIGLLFHHFFYGKMIVRIHLWQGLLLGFLLHTATLLWFLTIPGFGASEAIFSSGLPMLIAFTPATAILAAMIAHTNERIELQQELSEDKRKFELLYRQSPNAYFNLQIPSGKILDVSESAIRMTGFSRHELLSMTIANVLNKDNLHDEEGEQLLKQILSNQPLNCVEFEYIPKIGPPIWVAVSAEPEKNSYESTIGVKLMLDDISSLKETQEELLASHLLLKETSALGHIGGWEIDVATGQGSWTEETAKIYGFSKDEPLTLELGLHFYHPEDRKRIDTLVARAIEYGERWDDEFRIVNKNNQLRWIHSVGAAKMVRGKAVRLVGIVQDITDSKLAEGKIKQLRKERRTYQNKIRQALLETVHSVALTVEKRDPYTSGHMSRVSELAEAIAIELGLSQHDIDGIALAADIHDLGKIYIPAEILNRPGKLSDAEFELIKTHSQVGYDILKDVDFPWPVANMILQHHERLDGSGYPNGLKGEQLLLQSKILSVADVIEAVSSHRPYRPALGIDKGIEVVNEGRGSQFDPVVVDAAIKVIKQDGFEFQSSFS